MPDREARRSTAASSPHRRRCGPSGRRCPARRRSGRSRSRGPADGRAQPDDPLRVRRADDRARGLGPIVSIESAAAPAVPLPDDEPLGFWSASSAWYHLAGQVGEARRLTAEAFAHPCPVFPRTTTPRSRSTFTIPNRNPGTSSAAVVPFDVYIGTASIGPSSGSASRPRARAACRPARRSSDSAASRSAFGLSCVTAFSPGALVQGVDADQVGTDDWADVSSPAFIIA